MADRINIPADRYRWAIQRAGYSVDEFIDRYANLSVSQWITGHKVPTIKQLETFAKTVNLPFGYLFLREQPDETLPFPMFRGEAGRLNKFDLNVYDTVTSVQQRQEWLEVYLVENEIDTCSFVGSITLKTPVAESVAKLRQVLNLETRWALDLANAEMAVSKLSDMLEDAGVFLVSNGVVGNNTHRPLKVSECRGFALVSQVAPYIFVNSSDAVAAQLFTLVHEAAHLLLGVSAGHAEADTLCDEIEERYCNQVAAEFLVPAVEFHKVWAGKDRLKEIARYFCVSELVIARRAHDLGLLSDADYREFWKNYVSRRACNKKKSGGGGNFYRTSVKRVGRLFATHVKNAVNSGHLSYIEAYRLTGLYGRTYSYFMNNTI